jgi:ankyrin repeat protein
MLNLMHVCIQKKGDKMRKILIVAIAAVIVMPQMNEATLPQTAQPKVGPGISVQEQETVDKKNAECSKQKADLEQQLHTLEPQIADIKQQISELQDNQQIQSLTTQIADINQQIPKLQDQLKVAQKIGSAFMFIRPALEKELQHLQGKYHQPASDEQRADLARKIDDLSKKLEAWKTPKEKDLEKQLQDLNNKLAQLETQKRHVLYELKFPKQRVLAQLEAQKQQVLEQLDINAQGPQAAIEGFMKACEQGSTTNMQKYLAIPNFNINEQRPSDGATGLMLAIKAQYGIYTNVAYLLSNGANVYIKDNEGKTALEYVIDRGDLIVLNRLLTAAPIIWDAVDAACAYALKKIGKGKIVDYLSGKEVEVQVMGSFFSRGMTTGQEAFDIYLIKLKLPDRGTVIKPATIPLPSLNTSSADLMGLTYCEHRRINSTTDDFNAALQAKIQEQRKEQLKQNFDEWAQKTLGITSEATTSEQKRVWEMWSKLTPQGKLWVQACWGSKTQPWQTPMTPQERQKWILDFVSMAAKM